MSNGHAKLSTFQQNGEEKQDKCISERRKFSLISKNVNYFSLSFGSLEKKSYLCPQTKDQMPMAKSGFLYRAFHLYYDGFRSMTLGKTLWLVIAIKLFIIFVVLKIFFFPNFLSTHTEKGTEADFVANELTERTK